MLPWIFVECICWFGCVEFYFKMDENLWPYIEAECGCSKRNSNSSSIAIALPVEPRRILKQQWMLYTFRIKMMVT